VVSDQPTSQRTAGLLCAFAAYGWWGLVPPVYFSWLEEVRPKEILAHRIFWSLPLLAAFLAATGRLRGLAAVLRSPHLVALLLVSTLLVSINWYIYIDAVANHQIVQTSLGYFINPLINVVLGMLFFHERLRLAQWGAVGLAAAGVLLLAVGAGEFPWIALTLALSFGLYGMVRKLIPVDATTALTVEVLLLLPIAAAYQGWLLAQGESSLGSAGVGTGVLLAFSGFVTVLPLVWFGHAARALPLSTLGLIQYLAPTCQFLVGVFGFHEDLDVVRLCSFVLIWIGLAIFSTDSLWAFRQRRRTTEELATSQAT
jgi:chloramphenicol-sensitive protein RarD